MIWMTVAVLLMIFSADDIVQGQNCQAECQMNCGTDGMTCDGSEGRIVNVAYGKPATVSTVFDDTQGTSGQGCMLVNGRTSTAYRTPTERPLGNANCVHTNFGDFAASWFVDLGRQYTIDNITIFRRAENAQRRMAGLSVLVESETTNQTCYSFPNSSDNTALDNLPEQIDITCDPPLTGHTVWLQKHGQDRDQMYYFINVCEVQVWVCREGYTGVDCRCRHCKDNAKCDDEIKTCPDGCDRGWRDLTYCDQPCSDKTYGVDCGSQCGLCKNGSEACDTVTGHCSACQSSLQAPLCQVCLGNKHGSSCDKQCSALCGGDGSCDRISSTCLQGCVTGYVLKKSRLCELEDTGLDVAVVAGAAGAGIVVLLVIVVVLCVVIRRKRLSQKKEQAARYQSPETILHSPGSAEHPYDISGTTPCNPSTSGPRPTSTDTDGKRKSQKLMVAVKPTVQLKSNVNTNDDSSNIYYNTDHSIDQSELGGIQASNQPSNQPNHPSSSPPETSPRQVSAASYLGPEEYDDESPLAEGGHANANEDSGVYASFKASEPRLDSVQKYLVDRLATGSLVAEFLDIKKVADGVEQYAGGLPKNSKKNRFKKILPCQACKGPCMGYCGDTGLTREGNIVNIAFNKPAGMSSVFSDTHGPSGAACMAVNGNTSSIYLTPQDGNPNCVHTNAGDFAASWYVDLGHQYTITNITIYSRDNTKRMAGLSVLVENETTNQTCYSFPNSTDPALNNVSLDTNITCNPPLIGSKVWLKKHGQDKDGMYYFINVCEVQVWALVCSKRLPRMVKRQVVRAVYAMLVTGPKPKRSWQQAKATRERHWEQKRDLLVRAAIQLAVPPSNCCKCNETEKAGIIQCQDCGPQSFFCQSCYEDSHTHSKLHYPQQWKARYPELPHERLSFAIPVFHAYGHKLLCQVTKSVRSTKGVGQADGENLERLWSYLRTFGPMTKEMEASKRIDLLSYALFHYSRKERKKLGQSLQQRLDRSAQGKAEAKKDIELLTNFFEDVVIDEELVKGWATEDAEAIKSASNSTARVTDADDYVLKLSILYFNPQDTEAENDVILAEELHGWDRSAWAADSEQYKQSLQRYAAKTRENLLRKLRQGCFDRLTHIDQLRKYGIGQALSQQIGKNIKSATKKLLDDLKSYNKLAHIPAPPHFPMKLSIEEVTVPESDCFSYSIQLHTSSNFGMSKAKRQLVAAFAKKKRAEEEHDLVEADKTATLQFFQKEHTRLISFMKDLFQDDEEEFDLHGVVQSCHSRGILSFLFHKLWAIEREIEQFLAVWGQKNTLCNVASNFVFESLIENASEIPRETDDEVVFMIDDLMEQLTEPVDAQQVLATLNDNDTGNDDITV